MSFLIFLFIMADSTFLLCISKFKENKENDQEGIVFTSWAWFESLTRPPRST